MAVALRSNSFNYVPQRDVAREPGRGCPLSQDPELFGSLVSPLCVDRAILLRLKDRLRLCVTETRDFEQDEIRETRQLEQVYADVSHKLAPDDFAADFVKLDLDPECGRCPRLKECPTAFTAAGRNVFVEDDARVRAILRTLTGHVLDVGAGHAPYAEELAPRARAGELRYVAIDPDAERLALLERRLPWAETRVGTLRSVAPLLASASAVLFLRSINHLPDPDEDLALAQQLLEPGGTLLLVDDVPFGLVRSADHAARAEVGPGRFEHHRRENAAEVHDRCSALSLGLLERIDVGPRGSNQWLLRYEKSGK